MNRIIMLSAALAASLALSGEVQATSCQNPAFPGTCVSNPNPPVPPKFRVRERFNKPPIVRYFQPRYWWRGVP